MFKWNEGKPSVFCRPEIISVLLERFVCRIVANSEFFHIISNCLRANDLLHFGLWIVVDCEQLLAI